MNTLIERIERLAGVQRAKTFRAAAEFILREHLTNLVETGCYRGCDADGQSTIILSLLANVFGGRLTSIDIDPTHIEAARKHAKEERITNVDFIVGDSVVELGRLPKSPPLHFVYLDSFDHDPANPGPCQRHELAEIGAIYSRLAKPCAVLLDDNVPETGGKPLLGSAFLKDRGWHLEVGGYQLLYTLK